MFDLVDRGRGDVPLVRDLPGPGFFHAAMDAAVPIVHGAASLLGSALVIAAALQGDMRGYINIAMAVVIIALGLAMAYASKSGKKVPRVMLLTHAVLAVGCYALLGLFALAPQPILI